MTTIQTPPQGTGAQPGAATGPAPRRAATAATPVGVSAPASSDVSSALLEMSYLLDESKGGSTPDAEATSVQSEPVSNSNGAPWLPPPGTMMSADDIAMMCSFYASKSTEDQLQVQMGRLTQKTNKQLEELDRSNKLIEKNIEAAKKAKAARKTHGILGWIRKSVTIVAAVVAVAALTFATGGAAGPLVMTVAVGALLNALMSFGSEISPELGGPDLPNSMSAALQLGLTVALQKCGAGDELANGLGMMLSGLIGCFMKGGVGLLVDPAFAGQLVGGAAMLGGTGEEKTAFIFAGVTVAAALVSTVVLFRMANTQNLDDTVGMVTMAADGINGMTQASLGAYQAKLTFAIGNLQAKLMNSQADLMEIGAIISRLQSQWELSKDEVNRIIDSLSTMNAIIADILNGEYEQKSGMLAQMNGRATV